MVYRATTNDSTYRGGSVIGALLIITVGGLFLYANLNPAFTPWEMLAKYWPLLVVVWGVGKLVEFAFRRWPSVAAAAHLTAGDIVALVFLIIIGTVFTQAVQHISWKGGRVLVGGEPIECLLGDTYEFTEELGRDMPLPTVFQVRDLQTPVMLKPGDGNQTRLAVHKKVCANSEVRARHLADAVRLMVEKNKDGYAVRLAAPVSDGGASTQLEIQVPKTASLQVSLN